MRHRQSEERGRRKILKGERDASPPSEFVKGREGNDGKGGSVYVAGGLLCRNHTERKGGESGLCIAWPSKEARRGFKYRENIY